MSNPLSSIRAGCRRLFAIQVNQMCGKHVWGLLGLACVPPLRRPEVSAGLFLRSLKVRPRTISSSASMSRLTKTR